MPTTRAELNRYRTNLALTSALARYNLYEILEGLILYKNDRGGGLYLAGLISGLKNAFQNKLNSSCYQDTCLNLLAKRRKKSSHGSTAYNRMGL